MSRLLFFVFGYARLGLLTGDSIALRGSRTSGSPLVALSRKKDLSALKDPRLEARFHAHGNREMEGSGPGGSWVEERTLIPISLLPRPPRARGRP